nr:LOW QUALITY PROTEIN: xyloside xylosyltransferase 1 [Vicugna pacos]
MAAAHRPPPRLLSGCRGTDLRCGSVAAGSSGRRCMGHLRGGPPCVWAMARLGAVRSHYCALFLSAALAVCAFYYLGSGRETFSNLHFVSEEASREVAKALLRELLPPAAGFKCKVVFHDVGVLTDRLFPVVEAMQKHFSAGSGTYYSDSIFFLSVAMHQIMPKEILRIIQLDLDLKYKTNIRELFEEFDNFLPGAVIGIAREMQPVYRHTFWQFRHENPKTRVGGPPPEGLPGFNSGVMLLNLEAMRQSPLYGRLLEPAQVQQLANKYRFRGHLGDQDFFTMIGMEHPELFHVLDCTWNRQLCTWWRDHGYSDVFEAYFRCEGHVKIYHGNCNTPIPEA